MFKLTSRNRVVLLKRLEHFDVRSMVDKSTDHGNEFINVLQLHRQFLKFNNTEFSRKIARARKPEKTRHRQFISIFCTPPIGAPESFSYCKKVLQSHLDFILGF